MSQNAIAYRVVNWLELSEEELPMLRRTAAGKWVIPGWDDAGIDAEISAQESQEFQSVRELTKTEEARVGLIFSYLKEYEPQPTADNLEKVSHYLEAFHHFCELAAWEEAWEVLFIRCDTPTREELHNQLHTWGYYRLRIELYNQLLGKLDNKYRDSICYCGLGIAYDSLGDYRLAIEYHEKHLEIALETGDRNGEGRANGNLGNAYQSLGDYRRAIEYHEKHLEIAREIGDLGREGGAYGNLGIAYDSLGDYRLAIEYHQKRLQIARELSDRGGEGRAYGNLGIAYAGLKQYQEAIKYHEQSLAIEQEIENRHCEALSLQALAILYQQVGRIQEGFAAGYQANQILQELELPLNAMPYPNWMKAIGRFAQRGKWQLGLLFLGGLVAFPFFLVWIVALMLWRLLRAQLKRR